MSSLKDKTARGLLWGSLSNGLQQLLNLLIGIFLARRLSEADYGMVGMVAIFTYEFPIATQAFKEAGVQLITISNYSAMIQAAVETNYVKPSDVEALEQWREDPANWTPARRVVD